MVSIANFKRITLHLTVPDHQYIDIDTMIVTTAMC